MARQIRFIYVYKVRLTFRSYQNYVVNACMLGRGLSGSDGIFEILKRTKRYEKVN